MNHFSDSISLKHKDISCYVIYVYCLSDAACSAGIFTALLKCSEGGYTLHYIYIVMHCLHGYHTDSHVFIVEMLLHLLNICWMMHNKRQKIC